MDRRVIIFVGFPGSGKGTQANQLRDKLGMMHLSTGELFRNEANSGSEIGKQMLKYMEDGQIIPKELTFDYLTKELSKDIYKKGIILDGYPKDEECAEFIFKTLEELGYTLYMAIHFNLTRKDVEDRLIGRLHCKTCELDYHITKVPPQIEGKCDICTGPIEARLDDNLESIRKRLDVFEQKTTPVLKMFQKKGIYYCIDASKKLDAVTDELFKLIANHDKKKPNTDQTSTNDENSKTSKNGPYYLRTPAVENDPKFHNHIDAESPELLEKIIREIEAGHPTFDNKIYPVTHLCLGPQVNSEEFSSIYKGMPNFHTIDTSTKTLKEEKIQEKVVETSKTVTVENADDALDELKKELDQEEFKTNVAEMVKSGEKKVSRMVEAFSTGKMGDKDFNYRQIIKTLEVCQKYPGRGVMTELEIEILEMTFNWKTFSFDKRESKEFSIIVANEDELPRHSRHMTKLIDVLGQKWVSVMSPAIKYELHHGCNLPKEKGSTEPPISPEEMVKMSTEMGFCVGGWFIFQKEDVWSYRCNEFSNKPYGENVAKLVDQGSKMCSALVERLKVQNFSYGCSLELVKAMWKF